MSKINIFFLNGQKYSIDNQSKITLFELITYFNYNKALLVLEYNYSICNKKDWGSIFLNNNDKIEIVTIVGGG